MVSCLINSDELRRWSSWVVQRHQFAQPPFLLAPLQDTGRLSHKVGLPFRYQIGFQSVFPADVGGAFLAANDLQHHLGLELRGTDDVFSCSTPYLGQCILFFPPVQLQGALRLNCG
jgi:hypothetical protein